MKPLVSRQEDGFTVITIPESLDQNDWMDLRNFILRTYIDQGQTQLVFDCECVPELPSIAFGSFTCLARDVRRSKGTLHLIHISELSRRILSRIRLDALIPIRGSLSEVIRETKPPDLPAA